MARKNRSEAIALNTNTSENSNSNFFIQLINNYEDRLKFIS